MSREGEQNVKESSTDDSRTLSAEKIQEHCWNAIREINGIVSDSGDQIEKKKIDSLIDAMYLELLHLIEKQILQQKLLDENISRARLILARNRLQQGIVNCATSARLPRSTPYRALCRLVEYGMSWGSSLKLFRSKVNPTKGYFEPLRQIFGSLVPHSLRLETRQWERCVEQIVECANIQRELQSLVESIEKVKWARRGRRRSI